MPESYFTINDIKITKKGRYALFCNDEFLFSVDEETLLKHHIKIDSQFTSAEIDSIRKDSDYFKAREKALTYLDLRDHSEGELFNKLCRNFDEMTSAEVISKLKETGIINDSGFAQKYFAELIRKGNSRRQIAYKMSEKGISHEITEQLIDSCSVDDKDVIREIIDRRFTAKVTDEAGRKKVISHLINKGFGYGDIRTVIAEFVSECED